MAEIIKEILKRLPENKVSDACYEGANIVLYTKDKDFFLDNQGTIKTVVDEFKKRIELRPDPAITMDIEKAEAEIKSIMPEEAKIGDILFEPHRSRVIIEAEKPGLAIGKQGALLREIRAKTLWIPLVRRMPAIKSNLIENIRAVLYEHSDYRRKFLDRIGHRIYDGWIREKKNEWIRVSYLGGAREVGRSCIFLQTPESRILLDCGVNVASEENAYPFLEAPEFKIDELDAVIVSHSHLDHCGFVPFLFKYGYKGPVYCSVDHSEPVIIRENGLIRTNIIGKIADKLIEESDEIKKIPQNDYVCANINKKIEVPAFSFEDYKIRFRQIKKVIRHKVNDQLFEIKVKTGRKIKVTGSHSVFVIKKGEIKEAKVKELEKGDYLVVPHKLPSNNNNNIKIRFSEYFSNVCPQEGRIGYKSKIPAVIEASAELMKILGYFTAEGHLDKRSVAFTFGLKDEKYVNDLINCTKKVFGVYAKRKIFCKTRIRVSIHSKIIKRAFSEIFFKSYTTAINKRVPEIVFNVSNAFKKEFLNAYFAGDGYINIANKTISAVSVSKNLISDISYLCSQLGFTYTLFDRFIPSSKTKNRVFEIIINTSEYLNTGRLDKKSCELIPLLETKFGDNWYYHRLKNKTHVTKKRLSGLFSKKRVVLKGDKLAQQTTSAFLIKLANSDLSFLPVVNIKKVRPATGYVYDFSVEDDENFVGGAAPICLHNTEPTRDVMALLTLDYVKIMKSEGKEPIYDTDDIKEMVKHTICLDYNEVSDVTPDVRITLYDAGHVLGSSMIHMHVGNGLHNLLYTGDLKFGQTRLLDPAVTTFPRLETLMIESTYGGKDNILPSRRECELYLAEIMKKTIERKGKVLIPVLGAGRAQEVMLIVENLIKDGYLEKIPVYIDGMVWDVTAIHTTYPEFLNDNVRKQIFHKDSNPFLSDTFKRIGSPKERKEVLEEKGSCVILATSGMLVGGPSVEYLKGLATGSMHSIVFVCYQGEGSLGRRIQRGEKEIIFKSGNKQDVTELKLEVHTLDGFTGHSGRKQLMSFVYKCSPKPKKVIVNHGESSRCLDLASSIHKINRIETVAPRDLEAIRIK